MLGLFAGDGPLLYSTGHDADRLVVRPVDVLDGAVPAANSVAAGALVRLGALSGDESLAGAGRSLVDALWSLATDQPLAAANTVAAGTLVDGGTTEVVVTGERPDLVAVARTRYEPTMVLAWGEPTASPLWAQRSPGLAYVCRAYTCRTPAATPAELARHLDDQHHTDHHDTGRDPVLAGGPPPGPLVVPGAGKVSP
ncbi:MAG: hypothetical protein ABSG81_09085, partial [Acidimicrobiales bacterium]